MYWSILGVSFLFGAGDDPVLKCCFGYLPIDVSEVHTVPALGVGGTERSRLGKWNVYFRCTNGTSRKDAR